MENNKIFELVAELQSMINKEVEDIQLINVFKKYDNYFSKKDWYRVVEEMEYIINDNVYLRFSFLFLDETLELKRVALIIQ